MLPPVRNQKGNDLRIGPHHVGGERGQALVIYGGTLVCEIPTPVFPRAAKSRFELAQQAELLIGGSASGLRSTEDPSARHAVGSPLVL